jgi:hypothetical protein
VISAKQTSPNPGQTKTTTATATNNNSTLPSSAPGFFTQIGDFFNGIAQGFASLWGGGSKNAAPSSSPAASGAGQLPTIK